MRPPHTDPVGHGPAALSTDPTIAWTDPQRRSAFERWLAALPPGLGIEPDSVRAASADASFRRYFLVDFRAGATQGSRIVMDAPPEREDCRPFVQVAEALHAGGLNVPQVLDWNREQGFLLLSDLGSTTYLAAIQGPPALDSKQASALYLEALEALVRLQGLPVQAELPPYDRALMRRELDLFPEWYVARHCATTLTPREQEGLERSFALILDACLAQPTVLVHRDYHSRNLMRPQTSGEGTGSAAGPGILDFQDAVRGPASYDLASLLRDAYVEWDEEVQIDWAVRYWERARRAGLPVDPDFGGFWRDLEWMGLQRHLKVLGIFARLCHRDGKDGYLRDLPLVWRYAHRVAVRYSGLKPLALLLERLAGTQREAGYTF